MSATTNWPWPAYNTSDLQEKRPWVRAEYQGEWVPGVTNGGSERNRSKIAKFYWRIQQQLAGYRALAFVTTVTKWSVCETALTYMYTVPLFRLTHWFSHLLPFLGRVTMNIKGVRDASMQPCKSIDVWLTLQTRIGAIRSTRSRWQSRTTTRPTASVRSLCRWCRIWRQRTTKKTSGWQSQFSW